MNPVTKFRIKEAWNRFANNPIVMLVAVLFVMFFLQGYWLLFRFKKELKSNEDEKKLYNYSDQWLVDEDNWLVMTAFVLFIINSACWIGVISLFL